MKPRTTEQTATIFNEWADRYDTDLEIGTMQMGPLAGYAGSLSFAGGAVARQLGAHSRLLDMGVGTGAFADQVIAQHQDGSTLAVTGCDPSEGMRRRLKQSHSAFTVEPGDFLAIPSKEDGWDAIISSFAFHEVNPAQRPLAVSELIRVLCPGGMLALLDIMFASSAALIEAQAISDGWDPSETYHVIGDLDSQLREAGLTELHWWQTAPMHWLMIGHRAISEIAPQDAPGPPQD